MALFWLAITTKYILMGQVLHLSCQPTYYEYTLSFPSSSTIIVLDTVYPPLYKGHQNQRNSVLRKRPVNGLPLYPHTLQSWP